MSQYEPYEPFGGDISVKVDLSICQLLMLVMKIMFINGILKDYLMKQLILLRHLIMKLLHT